MNYNKLNYIHNKFKFKIKWGATVSKKDLNTK
jgi:hypothetical protein